jgi:hypothetical protein
MKPSIESVDLVEAGVIVNFGDGVAALFSTEFLYKHRAHIGNALLSEEEVEEKR